MGALLVCPGGPTPGRRARAARPWPVRSRPRDRSAVRESSGAAGGRPAIRTGSTVGSRHAHRIAVRLGTDLREPRHLDAPAVQRALRETREGRAMAQFARFLVTDVDSSDGGMTVYLRDARYARVERAGWGVVSVRLSRQGGR